MENEKRELRKLQAELDAAENPQGRGPFGGVKANPFDQVPSRYDSMDKDRGRIARIKRAIETKKKSVEQRTKAHADVVKKQNPTKRDNRSARQKRIDAKKAGPFAGAKGGKGGKGPKGSSGSKPTHSPEGIRYDGGGGPSADRNSPNYVPYRSDEWFKRIKSVPQRPKGDRGSTGSVGTRGLPGRAIPTVGKPQLTKRFVRKKPQTFKERVDEERDRQKALQEKFDKNKGKRPPNPQTTPTIGPPGSALIPWYNRPSGPAGYDNPKDRNYDPEWHTKYPSVTDRYGNIRRPSSDEIIKAKKADQAERRASAKITAYMRRQDTIKKAQSENSSGGIRWLALQTDLEAVQKLGTKQYNIMKEAKADIAKITNGNGYQVNIKKVYDKDDDKGTSGPKGPKGILGIDGTTNQVLTKPGGDQYGTHHTHPTHPHAPH
jgi:hypothetical protein